MREWEARVVELNKELAAPNLSTEDKAKLEKERAMYERFLAARRKPGASVLEKVPA